MIATHLLYIDDLKAFTATESKLTRIMKVVKDGMECIRMKWNEKKCPVAHVKIDRKIKELKPINSLDVNSTYMFLGVLEIVKQKDKRACLRQRRGRILTETVNHLVLNAIRPV